MKRSLAIVLSEVLLNEDNILKSINFGKGSPTKKQLNVEKKLLKELEEYGLNIEEYRELRKNS